MNRRSFLQSILAAGVAPAVCRAESLMKMVRRDSGLIVPDWRYATTFYDLRAEMLRKLENSMLLMHSMSAIPSLLMGATGAQIVFRREFPWEHSSRIVLPSTS